MTPCCLVWLLDSTCGAQTHNNLVLVVHWACVTHSHWQTEHKHLTWGFTGHQMSSSPTGVRPIITVPTPTELWVKIGLKSGDWLDSTQYWHDPHSLQRCLMLYERRNSVEKHDSDGKRLSSSAWACVFALVCCMLLLWWNAVCLCLSVCLSVFLHLPIYHFFNQFFKKKREILMFPLHTWFFCL